MSPLKSALTGLAVGLIAYFVVGNIGAIFPSRGDSALALIGTEVSPSLSPGDNEVTNRVTKSVTKSVPGDKTVSPGLAPTVTNLAPSPLVTVTPRISSLVTPTVSPTASVLPRLSVTPNPTPTPTPSATATPLVTPTPTPPAGTSHVVINEIAWMGTAADANDEWIELYNAGDVAVDLAGWTLWAQDGIPKISLSGSVPAQGYYLMERTSSSSTDISEDLIYTGSLENGGEILELRDAGGQLRDSVGAWYFGLASPDYASMERVNASQSGSFASNWATWGTVPDSGGNVTSTGLDAAGTPIRGTPKFRNSVTP